MTIANSAAAQAPWWQLVLMGLMFFGLVCLMVDFTFGLLRRIARAIGTVLSPTTYQIMYVNARDAHEQWKDENTVEHRDPTRPRSWEDEKAAKVYVADRMRQLTKGK